MGEPITLTAEELEEKIKEAVSKAVADKETELKKQHGTEMASLRTSKDAEWKKKLDDAVAEANLSADDKAKKKFEEEQKAKEEELAELRAYKKSGELEKKLIEKGLPTFFKNDSRLLNASEENIESVIETITGEFKQFSPNGGAKISTNVGTGAGKTPKSEQEKKFEAFRNVR